MVFTREKSDTSNKNHERCFFTREKNDTSNQKPQRCVSFAPKFPPFIAACSAASHTFNEKRSGIQLTLIKTLETYPDVPAVSITSLTECSDTKTVKFFPQHRKNQGFLLHSNRNILRLLSYLLRKNLGFKKLQN